MNTELVKAIPSWVSLRNLDASFPDGYGLPIPRDQASALREAAAEHQLAMRPSDPTDRQRVLRGLRSATLLPNEDVAETDATLKLLRVHLEDVPLDILEAACRAYCNVPGRRFFPRSAGELRTFINPLIRDRQGRAFRLRKLAEQAEAEDAERDRLEADPLTPEVIAAIKAEFGLNRPPPEPAKRSFTTAARQPLPTLEVYQAHGLTLEEAEQAVAMQAQQASRSTFPAKPIGAGVLDHVEDAIAAE